MQREHPLNLLAADTLAAARHPQASVFVAAPDAGCQIQLVAYRLDIDYRVRRS